MAASSPLWLLKMHPEVLEKMLRPTPDGAFQNTWVRPTPTNKVSFAQ